MTEYRCRVDKNTIVEYNGGDSVCIVNQEESYGRVETSAVTVSNIGLLIQALQDVQKIKYDKW